MKRTFQIIAFALFSLVLSGLMGFIYMERENQRLNSIHVRVCRDGDKGFLSEPALLKIIETTDSIFTKIIKQIETAKLEERISRSPYVESVDVFVNIDNDLMVNVKEKKVVLRVFNREGDGYYMDENAGILPLNSQFTPRVLVANGYINVPFLTGHESIYDSVYAPTLLSDLYCLTTLIRQNKFLQAFISQIYVNSKKEFDIIPQLGNQVIHLGSITNAEKKLDKLAVFYKEALPKAGWDKYKAINLKYKNQVVCTKK